MKISLLGCFFLLFGSIAFSQSELPAFGIKPLISTKSEVDSNFKKIKSDCDCLYETGEYTIKIQYSKLNCDDGWKVSRGVVLFVSAKPKNEVLVTNLLKDGKDFLRFYYHGFISSNTDLDQGFSFVADPFGKLEQIIFFPNSVQYSSNLVCKTPRPTLPMDRLYVPTSVIPTDNWLNVVNRVNDLFIDFETTELLRLHVFVYFQKKVTSKNRNIWMKKISAQFAKNLNQTGKQNPGKTLIVKYGGERDKSVIEAFILPSNFPAPSARPRQRFLGASQNEKLNKSNQISMASTGENHAKIEEQDRSQI